MNVRACEVGVGDVQDGDVEVGVYGGFHINDGQLDRTGRSCRCRVTQT